MEENKWDIKEKAISEGVKDTEVFSFGYLIEVILDYYSGTPSDSDSSESWKKGTEHDEKNSSDIPKDIDEMIKSAFKCQIKKFIK